MADISAELAAFQSAVYGEEVRGSMISAIEKINDVTEDSEATISGLNTAITAALGDVEDAIATTTEATSDANAAAESATSAASSATIAASTANTAASNATTQANAASTLNTTVQQAEAARVSAENARVTAENNRVTAETARAGAESNRQSAESTRAENETNRNTAEVSRVSAEATRVAQESARQSAETLRTSAEQSRASTFSAMQASFSEMEQQVLPPATYSTLGGVIIDSSSGLEVASDGTLSFTAGDFLTASDAAATYATITTVNGKANAQHNHSATDINNGTLAVVRGGTGVTTAAAERERLGLGSTTDALPVANGGTGASTASGALANLGAYSSSEVDTAIANLQSAILNAQALLGAIGTVPIANGGTGASTVDAARQALNASREWYATSSTAAATDAKMATCSGFVLEAGAAVDVRFANANTAASPTLNVNSTGAKAIYANNSTTAANVSWVAGETVHFVYDGTCWRMANSVAINALHESVSNCVERGASLSAAALSANVGNNQPIRIACTSTLGNYMLICSLTGLTLWDSTNSRTVWSLTP